MWRRRIKRIKYGRGGREWEEGEREDSIMFHAQKVQNPLGTKAAAVSMKYSRILHDSSP